MKTLKPFLLAWCYFLLASFCFLAACAPLLAQTTTPTIYARLIFSKVSPGQEAEFEKLVKENIKPMYEYRKKNSQVIGWQFCKIHFKSPTDKYNYVSIIYYDSWAKTEITQSPAEIMKAANPKLDVAAVIAKIAAVRQAAGEVIYFREDIAVPKNPPPSKYALIGYMQVKDNLNQEYVKVEKEDWKPMHQALADSGLRNGWGFWSVVMPGGTEMDHQYVTANLFPNYANIMAGNFDEIFKKAHPGKDAQALMSRTEKTRDIVRQELWQILDGI